MIGRVLVVLSFAASLLAANPEAPKTILEQGSDHWAFQPIKKVGPAVRSGPPGTSSIDELVAARLHKERLSFSKEASRAMLIRRLYFDLIGFPPGPDEVQSFISDHNPDAYEKLVDRLLASPHFGERWARHWLDVVRFAESNGFETNTPRKNAWPYRDYVIRAFNEDMPFDQFVIEQLAGDSCGADAATAFLVGGAWDEVKSPDIGLTTQQRMDELHDMVATTGSTFLGLTVGCARCHNHKFDPITQVDYYALQAIFAGVQHGERPLAPGDKAEREREAEQLRKDIVSLDAQIESAEPLAKPGEKNRRAPVNARLNIERFAPITAKRLRFTITAGVQGEPCIDELEVLNETGENVALSSRGTKASASGTYPNSELHKLEHINDGRVGNSRSWISNEQGKGWVQLDFAEPVVITKVRWGRDREEKFNDRLATVYRIEAQVQGGDWKIVADSTDRIAYGEKTSITNSASPLLAMRKAKEERLRAVTTGPMVYGGRFEQPGPTYRLQRGEALQKREQIAPALPVRFAPDKEMPADTPEQKRRLALAKWIVDPSNPLTARVIANRIWQFHFGAGILETPSDFGVNGARPSNPELLDWLANDLIEHGWSLKHLHREILLSAAYRQSSDPRPDGMERDSASRLLWRFPPRRLEAEALRDSILRVSGNLDLKMGGRGFDLFEPNENYVRVFNSKKDFGPPEWRRMIYLTKHRMQLDDTFGSFDCPDAGQIAPKRTSSTTPLQALSLLNSPFMLEQADIFAARLRREAGAKVDSQIRRAYWLTVGRAPEKPDIAASESLISSEGLPAFCRALLNANEFVYVF
jgi:hypothetical protein